VRGTHLTLPSSTNQRVELDRNSYYHIHFTTYDDDGNREITRNANNGDRESQRAEMQHRRSLFWQRFSTKPLSNVHKQKLERGKNPNSSRCLVTAKIGEFKANVSEHSLTKSPIKRLENTVYGKYVWYRVKKLHVSSKFPSAHLLKWFSDMHTA